MRNIRGALVVLCGLALLAGMASRALAGSPEKAPRADRPVLNVGDKWIRSDGSFDLVRIEKESYVFSAGPNREIHLTKDLVPAKIQKGRSVAEFDPPPVLAWPLELGKSGSKLVQWKTPNNPLGSNIWIKWEVEAYEDVRVAAGTFKAFRIVYTMSPGPPIRERWERKLTCWYAPEVGQLVKAAGEQLGMYLFEVVSVERDASSLEVKLSSPLDGIRVSTEQVILTGAASAAKGVAKVVVSLNGGDVSRHEEKAAPGASVPLRVPLTLKEGRNVILVTALDAGGGFKAETRTIFYEKASPAPTAPTIATPAQPPLGIALTSPKDQSRVEHDTIALAGIVTAGKGVGRVLVSLNGVEVNRLEEPSPQPALALNLPVVLREGQNTLVVTANEVGGGIQQEVRTIHYEKAIPLSVVVRYPEDRARVTEESSVVAALVSSSKGIARVTVTLNGVEVHQQTERTAQRSVVVTAPVMLREGVNAVVVSASEPDGTVRQEIRTVVYEAPKVAVAPPPKVPPPVVRDRWAVIIGAGRYESAEIPRLRYAVADAEAFHQVLVGPAGFKQEHVLLMTDRTEKKPTLRNIKWALGTFLARSAKKDDTVLIYFAGHGAPEVDQRGVERDGLAKYLIPADADPDDLYSTALPMDELQTIFGRIEAERVLVFLDACYSGAAGGRTFASRKTRAMNVDDLFLERLTRAKGRAIITASRPSEVSIELSELGHGIFTYYLVQGLKGAADLNRDGIVSFQELYEYVEQQVGQKSRAVGGNQHPVMKGELEGVMPLVKVSAK